MIFKDRSDAGKRLSGALTGYAGRKDVIILALPRGGLAVGFELSKALNAPLSIVISKKISMPGNEEFAIGAVSHGGVVFIDEETVNQYHISKGYVESQKLRLGRLIEERFERYRGRGKKLGLRRKISIITDDGVATGATMIAACAYVRTQGPKKVIIAVPVAPVDSRRMLEEAADEVVCLGYELFFSSVGQFYQSFPQVGEEEAIAYLEKAKVTLQEH